MLARIFKSVLIIAMFWGNVSISAAQRVGRTSEAGESIQITQGQRDDIIETLQSRIRDNFVLPDSASVVARYLSEQQGAGEYSELAEPNALARRLTEDLRRVSNDVHFGVRYDPGMFDRLTRLMASASEMSGRANGANMGPAPKDKKARNFFFSKLEILPGNVGYLKLEGMPALGWSKSTVDASMAFLAHSDAFILDVRSNPGGTGGFIPYLMSYFFPPDSTLLYTREFPGIGEVDSFYTYKTLPSQRKATVPLYVLMDQATGSAARNLSYTLQSFDRGILVGEATGTSGNRGAHSAGAYPLDHGFVAIVPIARVVNAVTSDNWRNTGVLPDVAASSVNALGTAHRLALETLIEETDDENSKWRLEQDLLKVIRSIEQQQQSNIARGELLSAYTGQYGDQTVSLEDGQLRYRREGMSISLALEEIEPDLFAIMLPAGAQSSAPLPTIRFDRDEEGAVVGLSLLEPDGTFRESSKKH